MSKEYMQKWDSVCIVVIIVSAIAELVAITLIVNSAFNATFLSGASKLLVSVIGYGPWVFLISAILFRFYFKSKIKAINDAADTHYNQSWIKDLERQIEQLKKK